MNRKDTMWIIIFAVFLVAAVLGMQWYSKGNLDTQANPVVISTISEDSTTSRAFTWQTDNPNLSARLQIVKGKDTSFKGDQILNFEGTTTSLVLDNGETVGVHKVEATGLSPGTVYQYRVGDGSKEGWSDALTFETAPEEEDFSFIYAADSQGETQSDFELWKNTMDQAFTMFPDASFVVHAGDFVDDAGSDDAWNYFLEESTSWISRIPIVPVIGNNDVMDDKFERFASYFYTPDNGASKLSGTETNYSFDYGSAHIAVLNTEGSIKQQTEWLKEDLSSTDKEWKLVAMHRPVYGGNMYKKIQDWAEIFDEYEVDLVLQGHNHEYSRSYPLKQGEITGDGSDLIRNHEGTVYVVANASGPKFNEKKENQFYHKIHFQNNKQMFAGITIRGNTLTYQAYDVDGKLLDVFSIEHEE
ncbi:metallophosphoesterase family protein [Paenibacillus polygoni]|uniref:Metallophosphoesterase family protein n=1 Tax=Paenibacillus polygoni TaxID=3050112 RepID=A0ABY8WY66_9BACL|nr:metallophosphoesterase family protein [Paenibacillus polygoni]WIV17598.1 metallophosphoesterase family protein [Paenibacillus polygoni]